MKTRWFTISLFMLAAFISFGLQNPVELSSNGLVYEKEKTYWVDSVAQSLTLEQKIGQFFMAATYTNKDVVHKQEIENLINKYNIGGVIFFQGDPVTQTQWYNDFQEKAQTPLFSSIDGEWGINMRLKNTIKYPRQLTLGAINDEEWIYKFGKRVAEECIATGININLAPVIDVNNNPDNPVINDRSFGEDKYNVSLKGLSYIQGMQDAGIMAVGKHFPGHGDTDADSHKTLPIINHDYERLYNLELYPFRMAFQNGLMGVMAAHLHIPALDNTENLAVSLSPKVTTNLLKDTLGFEGLVFSDALNMKGVSDYYSPGEVDKIAFLAGNDVLLFSVDIPKGIKLIKQAVENGEITEEYINTRLKKVLEYKYELNLHNWEKLSTDNLIKYLNNEEGKTLQKNLFEKAITVVVNEDKAIPLSNNKNITVASLAIGANSSTLLQNQLHSFIEIDNFSAGKNISSTQSTIIFEKLKDYEKIIIPIYDMSRYSSKNYGFSDVELNLINQLNKEKEIIIILFGTPYSLIHFSDFKNIIVAYEKNDITEKAVSNLLLGALNVDANIPISAGIFKEGTGISIKANTDMGYALPKEVEINKEKLDEIDNLAQKAIDEGATPGCQIVVAKEGKIIYNKSFGTHTYEDKIKVKSSDIYDVASITKMSATTLSLMKLYEEEKINLSSTIEEYLPIYENTEVGKLNIKEILAHQSGLPAWIPFYVRSIKDSTKIDNWYASTAIGNYTIPVSKDMYIHKDSSAVIWETIANLKIKEKKYKYSDLGFYILRQLVEEISQENMEEYVYHNFYQPMGLNRTTFLPIDKYPINDIIPSEIDTYYRNQTIQGYVHDMGCAMIGGVSGHAGLFSTALEQAAIMQMLLNEGIYNNIQFLSKETIFLFTQRAYIEDDNRRGLGFDKPVIDRDGGPTCEEVSDATFGHTGFTGTCAWADPKYNLVYVFISNRTYPSMENKKLIKGNYRTDIQQTIYNAMGVY